MGQLLQKRHDHVLIGSTCEYRGLQNPSQQATVQICATPGCTGSGLMKFLRFFGGLEPDLTFRR